MVKTTESPDNTLTSEIDVRLLTESEKNKSFALSFTYILSKTVVSPVRMKR